MIAGATERKRVLKDANKSETDRQKNIAITVCAFTENKCATEAVLK